MTPFINDPKSNLTKEEFFSLRGAHCGNERTIFLIKTQNFKSSETIDYSLNGFRIFTPVDLKSSTFLVTTHKS
jgi:hypothetical protein